MSCLASFSSWHVSCVPRDVNFMAHSLAAWFLGCKFVMSRKPLPSLLFSVSLSLFFFFAQMWGKVFVLCMFLFNFFACQESRPQLTSYKVTNLQYICMNTIWCTTSHQSTITHSYQSSLYLSYFQKIQNQPSSSQNITICCM